MTATERRLLWWSTGGVALLALAGWGSVLGLRWAWTRLLQWLLAQHVESLVALTLIGFAAWCVVMALAAMQPQVKRLERRGKWGPAEVRRLAVLMRTGSNHAAGLTGGGIEGHDTRDKSSRLSESVPAGTPRSGRRPELGERMRGEGRRG